jgi:hypothetical protein
MQFVGALDAILALATSRKLFDYLKYIGWRISVERPERNHLPDREFVGLHDFSLSL